MRASAEALLQSPIFESLSLREAEALAGACTVRGLKPRERLFAEGDVGSSLFVITEGRLALTRKGKGGHTLEIGILGPREVLGEMALLDSAPRSATATAIGPTIVLEMRRKSFEALYQTSGSAATKVIHALSLTLSQRLREVVDRIEEEIIQEAEDQDELDGRAPRGGSTLPPMASGKTLIHKGIPPEGRMADAPGDAPRRGELWRVLWGVQGS